MQLELADLQTDDELKDTFDAKDTEVLHWPHRLKVFEFEETSSSHDNSVRQYIRLQTDFLENKVHQIKLAFPTDR